MDPGLKIDVPSRLPNVGDDASYDYNEKSDDLQPGRIKRPRGLGAQCCDCRGSCAGLE